MLSSVVWLFPSLLVVRLRFLRRSLLLGRKAKMVQLVPLALKGRRVMLDPKALLVLMARMASMVSRQSQSSPSRMQVLVRMAV